MFHAAFVLFFILMIIGFIVYSKLNNGINKCSKHLVGKVIIVTGGSSGIGFETVKNLADRGAKVIIACNDEEQGTSTRDDVISATGNRNVEFRNLDLGSLSSVRKFADGIIMTEKQLDILINNAGILGGNNTITDDGLCLGMQINYFGPFLLTNLLLPLLKASAPSRIINVSSMAHRYGKIDFDNLNLEKETDKSFSMMKLYSNSKLCIQLMTVELARLLDGTGVTANSLHPGAVKTSIADRFLKDKPWMNYLRVFEFFTKSAWEGAQTTIYLAVSPEVSSVSGRYFSDCRQQNTSENTRDTVLARKLWEVSERLVKLV